VSILFEKGAGAADSKNATFLIPPLLEDYERFAHAPGIEKRIFPKNNGQKIFDHPC